MKLNLILNLKSSPNLETKLLFSLLINSNKAATLNKNTIFPYYQMIQTFLKALTNLSN